MGLLFFFFDIFRKERTMFEGEVMDIYKIENGSRIVIGDNYNTLEIKVDKHFNWFQKKMIKWCFGFDVFDYTEKGGYE